MRYLGYIWEAAAWLLIIPVAIAGLRRWARGERDDDHPDMTRWTDETAAWHRQQDALRRAENTHHAGDVA